MTGKARDNFTSHTQRLGHANCAGTQERQEIPHMWSYKVTVNQILAVEEYPLPTPEELFSTLSRGKLFSKLDLSQAYLQLPVQKESKPYLMINTHQGLYAYNRLPFGVASAPAIFSKING